MIEISEPALRCGFRGQPVGTHTSRTIMLAELRLLLADCPPGAGLEEYRAAVVQDNVLLKQTVTTRRASFRALRELYALAPPVLLFRALRDLWEDDPRAQPLLALLCATARDPILRASAELVVSTPIGAAITPALLAESVARVLPGRYLPAVLARTGRNLASSWKQSGHLAPRTGLRIRAECRSPAVASALLLGSCLGLHGERLLQSLWSRLLDAPLPLLEEQAFAASRRGWIEFRRGGGVVDVGFRHLLRNEEEEAQQKQEKEGPA